MTTATPPAPAPGSLRGAHVPHHLRGSHGRLRHRLLIYFVGGFAVILGLGVLGTILGGPSQHFCLPYKPCGPLRVMRPLVNQTVWRSSRYGFTLEYPGSVVSVSRQGPTGLILFTRLSDGNTGTILITGSSASSPIQAIRTQIANLTGVTQVATDTLPADLLLGPGVGYRSGAGAVFTGFLASPQGVGTQVELASEAATAGGVTVTVTVAGPSSDSGPNTFLYLLGDQIINSVRWPGKA
jgi:hypothetical protein